MVLWRKEGFCKKWQIYNIMCYCVQTKVTFLASQNEVVVTKDCGVKQLN